ncbi:Acyl-coenzyme A oxidase 2 [Tephrocybe sp. NHM501043]|nr:Acyl-coenzyme A oxidase 2 [Tephrocybe sp. NHM501043]
MFLSASFVALSIASGSYAAISARSNMYIVNRNIAPDGFTRSSVLAGNSATNGSFPGPLITANKGDHFQINVINQLTDTTMETSTSIHWHGFFQKGTAYADGPVGVNQCPISPGYSFLYDFSVPDQAGTFWYHSHLSTQYCDGLRGAIVVYDPNDPHKSLYDVDNESTVITLADWYHTPAPSAGPVPFPVATLINGLGRAIDGDATPFAVVNVEQGKRYRFRVVAISCDPNYIFSIDSHSFTVIEVDGVNHKPVAVDSLQIYAGQRYSVVMNANQAVDNYWIRAQSSAGPTTFDGGLNSAILRYKGAAVADPVTTSALSNLLLETSLKPLTKAGAPGGSGPADVSLYLDIAFANAQFTINGATFIPPTTPVLLQIISGAHLATDLLPSKSVYTLPANKVIELSIPGGTVGAPHPFHLHGHTFDVIRSANSSAYNYVDPPRRDVVSTGLAGDNVTIRFETDNSGPWILHW